MLVLSGSPNPPTPAEAVETFRARLITALAEKSGQQEYTAGLLAAISIAATLDYRP